jgi:hypothetical protein
MQKLIYAIAAVLIIVGAVLLAYSYTGFDFHVRTQVVSLGPLSLGTDSDVKMPFSPLAGGVCLVLGLGLIIYNRLKR